MDCSDSCHISDFKIWNKFGEIEFLDPIDLSKISVLDLTSSVQIQMGKIEIMQDDFHALASHDKLLKLFSNRCYLKFKGLFKEGKTTKYKFRRKMEKFAEICDSQLISINTAKNLVVLFCQKPV